jgi:hypothetical protein
VSYHLHSENNSELTLSLNTHTWYQVLELAEAYAWNPIGTVLPEWLPGLWEDDGNGSHFDEHLPGSYTPDTGRLVLLEDALNLADALERAFLAYEPNPALSGRGIFYTEWDDLSVRNRPAIGVLLILVEFCRLGAFWVRRG